MKIAATIKVASSVIHRKDTCFRGIKNKNVLPAPQQLSRKSPATDENVSMSRGWFPSNPNSQVPNELCTQPHHTDCSGAACKTGQKHFKGRSMTNPWMGAENSSPQQRTTSAWVLGGRVMGSIGKEGVQEIRGNNGQGKYGNKRVTGNKGTGPRPPMQPTVLRQGTTIRHSHHRASNNSPSHPTQHPWP